MSSKSDTDNLNPGSGRLELSGKQRRYLAKLAHHLEPTVMVGKEGFSLSVCAAAAESLEHHELIKLRFVGFKEEKREITSKIVDEIGAGLVQIVGNVATLYRPSSQPEKRSIVPPH